MSTKSGYLNSNTLFWGPVLRFRFLWTLRFNNTLLSQISEHMARFGVDERASITIADSALVSPRNMEQLSGAQRFIRWLPAT
jgi:hypothetical protein